MIYLNGAIAAIATANANPPAPVPGWLDTWIATAPPSAVITAYGAYTTGIEIVMTTNANCSGVRFWMGTGLGPVSVTATLWNVSTGLAVASEVINAVTGGAFYQTTGAFGSNALSSGSLYRVSTFFAAGYNTASPLPGGYIFPSFATYTVTAGFISIGSGYGYPAGSPQSFGTYVEPLF